MRPLTLPVVALAILLSFQAYAADWSVGVASVDVTPDYPIRLSGYGFRRTESEGVTHPIFAKAIAFGDEGREPAVLVAVDNLAIPAYMTDDLAARLERKAKLGRARLAVTATHTHTAPMLTNTLPTLFGVPIPQEHQAHIDRYTHELADKLEQVALAALADLKPAKLAYGIGEADLSFNRRPQSGPVDHDLSVLAIQSPDGALRAVYVSYACHCTTLSDNKLSGDWAGFVQDAFEKNHPGAVVITSVGCGADSNPKAAGTGEKAAIAAAQGKLIADAVERTLNGKLTPLTAPIASTLGSIDLPFDPPPTRAQWEEKAKRQDAVGHHARVQLARLDKGEALQTVVHYPIETWAFGDQLAMVFLPGEVVVDYALRLKREFDRTRLWVNAYSNDVPCYIPSERVLKEGGYEGGDAMVYYDRPTRFAPGLEQKIVDEVHRKVPAEFSAAARTEGVPPRTPEESLKAIHTKPGLQVELAATEPLIASPVAIDWAPDGRLWVCEMADYPNGVDQNWKPGGRVKILEDTDGDGRYDKATLFLDNLPFPTGVTAYGKGALVCAAPDILYAQDTDGDGKADKVEKLFTGFIDTNYQARVNSLTLGLDNWIYGANGLLGGEISGVGGTKALNIRGHDFRFRPLDGAMETVAGLTQQGRVRDDFGRWFGCDNSTPLIFFPFEERYLRRNPQVDASTAVRPTGDHDVGRVYPVSRALARFNDPQALNHITSGCGLGINRDVLLGDEYAGNAFVCEPVHNLVHRMILSGDGLGLTDSRAADEKESEFFASEDNWCRPVQVRTGPDGALYVVDMYRFLIEHPRWVQADRLKRINVRAGADMGRIYRIRAEGKSLRPIRDLSKLADAELAAALDTPNGTDRDRVHLELLRRHETTAAETLKKLAESAALPAVRVQALCVLDGVGALDESIVMKALDDRDDGVRVNAIRLSERWLHDAASSGRSSLFKKLVAKVEDPSPRVRHQLAFALGDWHDPQAAKALAKLAASDWSDEAMRAAVLSSASRCGDAILAAVLSTPPGSEARSAWIPSLIATIGAAKDDAVFANAVLQVLPPNGGKPSEEHLQAVASALEAMERRGASPSDFFKSSGVANDVADRWVATVEAARLIAVDAAADSALREAAIGLVGRPGGPKVDLDLLCDLAVRNEALRGAATAALRRGHESQTADRLIARWDGASPAARASVVDLLLGRDEWAAALLRAIEHGKIRPQEIPLQSRKRLTEHGDESNRQLAAKLFPDKLTGDRAALIERYQAEMKTPGRAADGAAIFAANCTACHALAGVGHAVGPDLAALRDKEPQYLLKNILDPSAVIEPRFINYQIVLKDHRVVAGVISAESDAAITLESGAGARETIERSKVAKIRAADVSLMPEGFESAISPAQMADLIVYLKSSGN